MQSLVIDKIFDFRHNNDIPLYINIPKRKGEGDRDMTFKIIKETEDTIYIDATSPYYDKYISGKRFRIPSVVYGALALYDGYLKLQVDVVNNTSNRLDIEELSVNVVKSEPDTIPYLYICTSDDICNSITFANGSWFNWGGFTFSYSLLKENEHFNGVYQYKEHIDFFEEDTTLNLLPHLIEKGYDFRKICETLDKKFSEEEYACICNPSYNFKRWYMRVADDYYDTTEYCEPSRYECICLPNRLVRDSSSLKSLFYPFHVHIDEYFLDEDDSLFNGWAWATAKLWGEIVFDNSKFKVRFIGDVTLATPCGFGAGAWENDRFNVALRTNDTNYILHYPYTTIIEPQGSEMVSLIIKASQSSNHTFNISLKNGDGLKIRSKNVSIHYLLPKNYIINN